MKNFLICLIECILLVIANSCQHEVENVSLGLDDYYYLPRMKKLFLCPAYTGNSYKWTQQIMSGTDSLLSTDKDYIFLADKEGTYNLNFHIDDGMAGFTHHVHITVLHEEVEYSPYTAKVYDYCPAPGQFINTLPLYEDGDTRESMRKKAEESLVNDVMISLGGYGGYVTFGFDHTVVNVPGKKDFLIKGNSFYSDVPAYKEKKGGSSEPGIVMVAYDWNMNGKADENEWYELAGSEYDKKTTLKKYSITYSKPVDGKLPIPDLKGNITDKEYIPWKDNQGQTGYIAKNRFHIQDYYPLWENADSLIFQGTCLPPNGIDYSGRGAYYVLFAYDWGYVDNHPNTYTDLNSFDVDWAVDCNGHKVHLPGVDFIRVYTAENQYCGWIGETSTEVLRATDLHLEEAQ